jgi:hypothetical protein
MKKTKLCAKYLEGLPVWAVFLFEKKDVSEKTYRSAGKKVIL